MTTTRFDVIIAEGDGPRDLADVRSQAIISQANNHDVVIGVEDAYTGIRNTVRLTPDVVGEIVRTLGAAGYV